MLAQEREYVIVVHGGAGAMENLEDAKEKSTLYYAALDSALSIGNAILLSLIHILKSSSTRGDTTPNPSGVGSSNSWLRCV